MAYMAGSGGFYDITDLFGIPRERYVPRMDQEVMREKILGEEGRGADGALTGSMVSKNEW